MAIAPHDIVTVTLL